MNMQVPHHRPPLVSFIIPTLNEERSILRCLGSVSRQKQNGIAIEVLIADAQSEDGTLDAARRWHQDQDIPMSVVENRRRIAEFGKAEALNIARGQFIVLLDADNEIVQDDWLRRALDTFRVFPDIFGFESHYLRIPHGNPINNYLTSCLHINEPLAYDIAVKPSLVETRRQEDLFLRKYLLRPGYPCGANGFVFRRESLVDFVGQESLEEGTVSLRLALSGRAYFAMIDGYGIRHYYISSMSKYLRKRAKIALKHVTRQSERDTWVEHTGFRLYLFAILHLTVLYPLLYSIVKACKSLDPLWLYHAPMAFLTTSVYLLNWIRIRFCRRRAW